jgi:hypothetical protein
MTPENEQGLFPKYRVDRLVDPAGKHDRCRYFVLDPEHDEFAREALRLYSVVCQADFPELATDLRGWLKDFPEPETYGQGLTNHSGWCPARNTPTNLACTCPPGGWPLTGESWD